MATLAVSFTRLLVAGTPAALAIGPGASGTFIPAGEGLFRADVRWRKTYMPNNQDLHGSQLIAAVKDHGSLPIDILISTSTRSAMQAAQDELEACLDQFTYETTLTVGGISDTWASDPGDIAWGRIKSRLHNLLQPVSLTIPVYPIRVTA